MYLSIATTHHPATDLGFLLHKHPERLHESELAFGKAYVFYPEASEGRCEAALVVDIDPIGLVRGRGEGDGLLDAYVNDRPYAATSFLSVAMAKALRTAMSGASRERPELAEAPIPLSACVTPLPVRDGGEGLVRRLFEPLGWTVGCTPVEGATDAPRYVTLDLSGEGRVRDLLTHLYVLIPVLDDDKHYWVGDAEVAKLLSRGEGWLQQHPERELIAYRYLGRRRSLATRALARLAPEAAEAESEDAAATDAGETQSPRDAAEHTLEAPIRLNDQRMEAVMAALKASGARSVADLGCGEGKLLARLLRESWAQRIIGVDASAVALERAERRLKPKLASSAAEDRLRLLHGALTYRDRRWHGVDAAVLVEVIEHLDPDRLPALARAVFGEARPPTVIVTTPNVEYNALFASMRPGAMRHGDHRFEWTRAEFRDWARSVEEAYGYRAAFSGIGAEHETCGAPTQMAVFSR